MLSSLSLVKENVVLKSMVFFFLLFCFGSILVTSFWLFIGRIDEEDIVVRNYQYFEKDYLKNETSVGVVSLFEQIEDFVSYSDVDLQKQVLISNFGTDEYECFGSCYCDDSVSRRFSQSSVLIKGVSYLLAAVSSVVAMNIAKEYFSEKCEEKYSNICESESIRSQVEDCQPIMKDDDSNVGEEDVERRVYFCYGNCVEFVNSHPNDHRPTHLIDCSKLKKEGEVIVYDNDLEVKSQKQPLSMRMCTTAKKRFQRDYLKDFCKEESKVKYNYKGQVFHTLKSGEKREYVCDVKRSGYLCAGKNGHSTTGKSQLKNVSCRQMEPKPTARNTAYLDRVWWEKKKEWDEL